MSRNLREPEDVLDPRHFENVRKPTAYAETLPGWCFTSQRFYDYERERIFFKTWNCVGHTSRVPNPGDYISFDFMDVPVLITRAEDGKIHAFTNACRHRGAELVSGAGNCKMLKCPYHAWAYALDGSLVGTPLFEESDAFQKADYGLNRIRLELWAGFMWINFDPTSEALADYLGDLPERIAPWRPEDMVVVSRKTYHVDANWKQYYENFSDPYHVPFVHKSTLSFKPVSRRELHDPSKYIGNYIMHRAWFDGTRGVLEGQPTLPEMSLPEDSKGAFYPWIYPNAGMGFAIDCMFNVEIYPEGPERTRLERSFLVPRAYVDLPDFHATIENYLQAMEKVQFEDLTILESQQRAVHSPFYLTGRFAKLDQLVHACELWILDRVLGQGTAQHQEAAE
jgi:choline monooxygenase